jgi:hypothetical protein
VAQGGQQASLAGGYTCTSRGRVMGSRSPLSPLPPRQSPTAESVHTLQAAPEDPDEAPAGRHRRVPAPRCYPRPGTQDPLPWGEHDGDAILRWSVLGEIHRPVEAKVAQGTFQAVAGDDPSGLCSRLCRLQRRQHLPAVNGGVRRQPQSGTAPGIQTNG